MLFILCWHDIVPQTVKLHSTKHTSYQEITHLGFSCLVHSYAPPYCSLSVCAVMTLVRTTSNGVVTACATKLAPDPSTAASTVLSLPPPFVFLADLFSAP